MSKHSATIWLAGILASPAWLGLSLAQAQSNTFFCGQSQGEFVTMARTARGNVPVIRWVSNYFSGSGYTPEKRCEIVSQKFQQFNQDGRLQYLTTGRVNGLPVICAASSYGKGCDGVLFTLKAGQNPNQVLQDLMGVRNRASGPIKQLGGGSTSQASNSDAPTYINMDNYLKNATAENTNDRPKQPGQVQSYPQPSSTDAIW
jgi:hypothetical protein